MKFLKKNLIVFLFLIINFSLFSQEVLSNLNVSWSNVLPGMIIAEPAVTSYGFCAVTDARTISAFSNSGKLLWEKNIGRVRNAIVKSLPDDFILLCDLNAKNIKVLNPSGTIIWQKTLDYTIINDPFAGRDGRFFLCGENIIECYGINGICKWKLNTEVQKKIPLRELPDGSIVVFLQENKGQTKGLRISPYGEMLEEIFFAGEIKNSYSSENGILLTFTDGSAGLFSLTDDFSANKWVLQKKNQNAVFVTNNNYDYLFLEYLKDGLIINEININNGEIIHSIKITDITGTKIDRIFFNEKGLLLIDNKSAALYTPDGMELWFARLPEKTSKTIWNYLIYTGDNHLVFCYKNWTLNSYKVAQENLTKKSSDDIHKSYVNKLEDNFDIQFSSNFSSSIVSEERIKELQNGMYGDKEEKWQNEIMSICSAYSAWLSTSDFGTRKEQSIFDQDSTGFQNILEQLMLLGNKDSQNIAASILSKTKNKSFQKIILQGISNNGYDPDGELLKSLEKLSKTTLYKDKIVIQYICDAVYSVCLFMGRPAYNSKGKDLLKNFLYPSFDSKTREYSRDTLKKIISLEL